ncbi:MAG: PDZ domain-containing protein [Fibrobacteres bacterium]|nr:PDZ domain-containing protein [Fibrobacterota bacterium]
MASYKEVASSLNRPQRLVLQFYSEDREVVFTGNVNFRPTSRMVQGEDGLTDHANCNIGTCVGSTMGAWIYKDYTLSQSTEISIPVSVLRRIASVECFFASNEPLEAPTKQGNNAELGEANPSSYATGVGMEIGQGEGGGLEITSITPGGQAERVGLSDGASIISIGGKEISDPTEASMKLHGAIGSIVRVCVSTSIRDFCRELTVRPLTDR